MEDQKSLYDIFYEIQEGVCAICGREVKLSLDYSPTCKCCDHGCYWCTRGILCHRCGMGIMFLFDQHGAELGVLQKAVEYAKKMTGQLQIRADNEPDAKQDAENAYSLEQSKREKEQKLREKDSKKKKDTTQRKVYLSPERKRAEEALVSFLSNGPLSLDQVKRIAEVRGISWGSMENAKALLNIRSIKAGFPAKVVGWQLPEEEK